MSEKEFVLNTAQPGEKTGKHDRKKLRRECKEKGRHTLKKHYALLFFVILIMILFGTEIASKGNGLSLKKIESGAESMTEASAGYMLDEVTEEMSGSLDSMIEWIAQAGENDEEKWSSYSEEDSHKILGIPYSKGTLTGIVNGISSGKPAFLIINAINSVTDSKNAGIAVLIVAGAIFRLLVWGMIFLIIGPSARRIFLEARTYERVQIRDFTHIMAVKKWRRATITMFVKEIYVTLWWLTIIGGIIKHYSYMMVPYIVAENPGIKAREAITLSRRMMYGHKWELFLVDVSYIGWTILGIFTFSLSEIFYSAPYKIATVSEYYAGIRALAKENKIEGAEKLDDDVLFEKASDGTLLTAYSDISEQKEYIAVHEEKQSGLRGFLLKTFGIWIGSKAKKDEYHEIEVRKFRIMSELAIIDGKAYPLRLNPRYHKITDKEKFTSGANYLKAYSIGSLIIMFFVFCFIGWAWEVSLHLVKDGVFVNRGSMHGPWLPIYGCGGVFMLLILNKFRKKPAVEILSMVILSGVLEYFSSWYLEATRGLKYWDYSGYFLNLNGRICAEGLIVFAIAGAIGVYLIAPALDELIAKIPQKTLFTVCLVLLLTFGADLVYSHFYPNKGKGITDYSNVMIASDSGANANSAQMPSGREKAINPGVKTVNCYDKALM